MIYVHVPFCKSFCTYCDFYSELCSQGSQQVQRHLFESYRDSVIEEIQNRIAPSALQGSPDTLYFGGGTPSVLPLDIFKDIVATINEASHHDRPYREFTIEANPDDIVKQGPGYVRELLTAGVNRISMGVQSFDDDLLKWMNRRHNAAQAIEAVKILRESGISNISIDLIFGLSQLSDEVWRREVRRAIALVPQHISAYALSVEEGSALHDLVQSGRYEVASDECYAAQYAILCEELSAAGYVHYEVSNFALPGYEAVHNSGYWAGYPYIGVGPAAHSYAQVDCEYVRSWNSCETSGYTSSHETLTDEDMKVERVMLALRTAAGLPEAELCLICGREAVSKAVSAGNLLKQGDRLRIPESRFFISDSIIRDLASAF